MRKYLGGHKILLRNLLKRPLLLVGMVMVQVSAFGADEPEAREVDEAVGLSGFEMNWLPWAFLRGAKFDGKFEEGLDR